MQRPQRLDHIAAIALDIGNFRFRPDPDPAINAITQMFGKLAEDARVDGGPRRFAMQGGGGLGVKQGRGAKRQGGGCQKLAQSTNHGLSLTFMLRTL